MKAPTYTAKPYRGSLAIPVLSDGQLTERFRMIQFVHERMHYETVATLACDETSIIVTEQSMGLWWIDVQCDLRTQAYTWSPQWIRPVDADELVAVKSVPTLHTYGYYGFFKPSIAEVLAFAPDDLHQFAAVSLAGPSTRDDLQVNRAALNAGFQVGEATYYKAQS